MPDHRTMTDTIPDVLPPSPSGLTPDPLPSSDAQASTPPRCCFHPRPWMKATSFELLTVALSIPVLSFSSLSTLPHWARDLIECELLLFIIFFFASTVSLSCLSPKLAFSPRYQILQYVRAVFLGGTTLLVMVLKTTSLSVLFLCLVAVYIPAAIFFAIWIKSTHNRLHQPTANQIQEVAREVAKPPPSYSDVDATPPSYTDYLRMYARKISNHVAPSDAPIRQIFNISETVTDVKSPSSTEEDISLESSNIPGTSDIKAVKVVPDTKGRSSVEEPVQLEVVLVQSSESAQPPLLTKLTAIPED